jgi:hypothetical protein
MAIPNIEDCMTTRPEKAPIGLTLATILLWAEGAFVGVLAVRLGLALLSGETKSLVTSVALFALVAAASAWVIYIGFGLRKGKRWARSGGVFWQLIQLAVATASFSGQFGNALIGWGLILPSVFGLAVLFSKKVVAATLGNTDNELDPQ